MKATLSIWGGKGSNLAAVSFLPGREMWALSPRSSQNKWKEAAANPLSRIKCQHESGLQDGWVTG